MKPMFQQMIFAIGLLFAAFTACAQSAVPATDADAAFRQRVAAFLDEWHDDAAHSRMRYFDKIAKNGVYIGTDKSERWTRDDFKQWAKPYFAQPAAWTFHAVKRNIAFSGDKAYVWFDEQLDTQMGLCQASGVIQNTKEGLRILHYQLSLAIPNPLVEHLQGEIKQFDAEQAQKQSQPATQ
jgi:hypothetical protein